MSDQAPELPEELVELARVVWEWQPPPGYKTFIQYQLGEPHFDFRVNDPDGGFAWFRCAAGKDPEAFRRQLDVYAVCITRIAFELHAVVDGPPNSYREALNAASRTFYEGMRDRV